MGGFVGCQSNNTRLQLGRISSNSRDLLYNVVNVVNNNVLHYVFCLFETGYLYVAQAGLELSILLPQPP
jgi:hypothetical protein